MAAFILPLGAQGWKSSGEKQAVEEFPRWWGDLGWGRGDTQCRGRSDLIRPRGSLQMLVDVMRP